MADRYLSSVAGSDANNGTTKALAKATLTEAISVMSAGDRLFIDSAHTETVGTTTWTFPGTLAAPNQVYSFDWTDAVEPPTTYLKGATFTGSSTAVNFTFVGSFVFYGLNINTGQQLNIGASGAAFERHVFDDCDLRTQGTGAGGQITTTGTSGGQITEMKNCRFRFSAAANSFKIGQRTIISGGSFISGTTTPTALITYGDLGRVGGMEIEGLDCTNLASGFHWILAASPGSGVVTVRNAKLPASWSGSAFSATPSAPGIRFRMHNSDNADTSGKTWEEEYAGSVKNELSIYRDSGATDGTTPYSWRMAATANASFPALPLVSPELPAVWNAAVGSSKTVTVEIVHDGASPVTDGEVWLEVQYLGTSGTPLSLFVSDRKALLSAGAAQAASAATWTGDTGTGPNGSATWNTLKLECTFTPQEAGYIQARVYLAKPSTTVFVDPKMTVA